jgi:hypothetical protein
MSQRRPTLGQLFLWWFARLPLVWAVLAGFGVAALIGSAEWYVRASVMGLVSLLVLGLGYVVRAHLIAQVRAEERQAPPPEAPGQQALPPSSRRRIRRRRDR